LPLGGVGFGLGLWVGEGFGLAVFDDVGVGEEVGVAVVAVGVAVERALATEDGVVDAWPAAAVGSSSKPIAATAAPASAHSRASRDTRLDRELKVFLAGVVGVWSHDRAASLRSLRT
jgi:hypothetical protein